MLKEFQEHIEANFADLKHERLLVALSGGIDSVVLTHLFVALGYSIHVAHCNFKLRGQESDLDEQFVVSLADRLELELHTKSFNTLAYAQAQKVSIQMAARDLRYRWFDELLEKHNLGYLVTAHHLDDSLETLLINLTRGTGLEGLTGISATHGRLIRPMLPFNRDQIEAFAQSQQLEWREDSSNQDRKYLRNKIRHSIVPVLKEMNVGFTGAFRQTLDHLLQSQKIIDETLSSLRSDIISSDQEGTLKLDLEKLKNFNDPSPYLYQLLKPYNFTDWKAIADLFKAQSGKFLLSNTHRLVKDRSHFILTPLKPHSEDVSYWIATPNTLLEAATFSLRLLMVDKEGESTKNTFYVDADQLDFPLLVRQRKPGDVFYPIGLEGKKKVSKFFKDEKFSLSDKENTWLLSSGDRIVSVLGHRMDDRFKLTEKTEKILQIEFSK